ncbi:MAG: hypothetical protein JWN48_1473 [Myxococcaceae bacterium]|nr:hypothetical protein [Myxococcaceae bacterium]
MYSELLGAFGRDAHYRPKRYRPRELLSPLARPQLRVAGRDYPVLDISSNGAALLLPSGAEWPVGGAFDAELIMHGQEAQRVSARVVRSEQDARGIRVALSLTHGFLDLEAAQRFDANTRLEQALSVGPSTQNDVPAAFREVIGEAVHLVQFYRGHLDPHEAAARARGEEAVCELAERAYKGLSPLYAELREKASRAARPLMSDPGQLRAAKAYTNTVLTPLLLSAPMIARSYLKPLGYPGDYQVMLYYYADAFEGETAFAKAFHRLFVQHPLSAGVCTRKDYVVERMERELAQHEHASADAPFYVTSLGCGPAMEVSGFVHSRRSWNSPIHWRLIDQEARTLQVAYEGAQRALAKVDARGSVECLNLAFGQLLKSPQLLARGGPQHFIYSTGLFDYLPTHTGQQLIRALYDCLTPSGEMLIGNAKGPNDYFFCPEFVLDWSLIYRTREEMRELASVLPSGAHVELELEPGGAYWFLRVRKPAA